MMPHDMGGYKCGHSHEDMPNEKRSRIFDTKLKRQL